MWKWGIIGLLFVFLIGCPSSGVDPELPNPNPTECGDCGYLEDGECKEYACCAHSDCGVEQVCINNECKNLACKECQHVVDHACVDYECCEDSACGEGSRCVEHACVAIECEGCTYLDGNVCKPHSCCEDAHCDDANELTFDICVKNECQHRDVNECRDDDGICPLGCNFISDNDCGNLCKGVVCDEGLVCVDGECQLPSCKSFGGILCADTGEHCSGESEDSSSGVCCLDVCVQCVSDEHCDDADDGTEDFCVENSCVYTQG